MRIIVADVETDNLLPDLTRMWCLSLATLDGHSALYADQPGYPSISRGITLLAEADRVIFHNGLGFDLWVINRFYPQTLKFTQVYDTLVVSRLLNPELSGGHSLGEWGARLGHAKVKHEEWDRWSEAMGNRCMVDVEITGKLYAKQQAQLTSQDWGQSVALEHQVALAISLQEQNGFRLDVSKAACLAAELSQEKNDIERALQAQYLPMFVPRLISGKAVFRPKRDNAARGYTADCPLTRLEFQVFNPGSRQQIEMRLRREYNWKPRKFTATGVAKLDEATLNEIAVEYPEARRLARYFRLDKQLGQLEGKNGWLKVYRTVDGEDRVFGSVNPNGAVTGRMSHFKPNLANVDKKDLRMREVWIPRDGYKLVGIDADSLELRMLGHYLARYDGGEFAKSVVSGRKEYGEDVHSRTKDTLKSAGIEVTRDGTKTITYAFLYGAGLMKLGLIIIQDYQDQGLARPTGSPTALGKRARQAMEQGIIGLGPLITKVRSCFTNQKYLIGLDGRRLLLRSEHAALNTLLQGAGAVVMKKALVDFHDDRLSTDYFSYCVNVHDEVQIEADPDHADRLGEKFCDSITRAGEQLGLRCPLAGSYSIGNNWKETH